MAKKALCLSGGGARGSFQMGAVRCLYEVYGFRPDVIAGTSVGSVNGIKLAEAAPPVANDAQAILAAVNQGQIDDQLTKMRELEQLWLQFLSPADFFSLRAPFRGTIVEDVVRELNTPSYSGPMNTEVNPQIDQLSALLIGSPLLAAAIPVVGPIAGLILGAVAADQLQKIRYLIEMVFTENSLLDLSPIEAKLRDTSILNIASLANGTPLYLSMVSLETGKLRYVNNRAEFFERDGVTPVATALTDADIDAALDENLQPLSATRITTIKSVVNRYRAAVNQIAAYRLEYSIGSTTKERRRQLAILIQQEAEHGNYYAKAAEQQIKGIRINMVIRDGAGNPDPIVGVLGSACMPVYFEPPVVGVERYVDGGVREIIPVEVVLRHKIDQLIGIVCSDNELPETESMDRAGLIAVAMRSLVDIALEEVVVGDLATAQSKGIDVRYIIPTINVHDTVVVQPSLIEISMNYGWLRAVDEMHPATEEQRKGFRQSSDLIARLRQKCLEIERRVATNDLRVVATQRWDYFELRVNRWAIMHVAARRSAMGLPAHPQQASWSAGWEREFRGVPPFSFPSPWSRLEARSIDNSFYVDLWPASSPASFNPDVGSIQDAGSDRIYWMVRGAIFEDRSGGPLPAPLANVVLPTGTHQYLPRVPSGMHLMAEVQNPAQVWLVAGGKRYASPSAAVIAAAGLSGSPVALVPQNGLTQIPDGGVPTFLGNLAVVDQSYRPLTEVVIERLEKSNTTADISLYNRSSSRLTGISVSLAGFDARERISVESAPTAISPNTVDLATLRLRPTRAGEFNGSLQINSSDPLFPSITVALKLRSLPLGNMATLEFSPDPVEINARVNSTTSYSMLTVTNTGAIAPSSVYASIEPAAAQSLFVPGIYLNAAMFTPGRAIQIPVFFYPTTAGRYNAELVLDVSGRTSNNHPYQSTIRIPLVGNAGSSKIRLSRNRQRRLLPERPVSMLPRFPGDLGGDLPALPSLDPLLTSLNINLGAVQLPLMNAATFFINNVGDLPLEIATILANYASLSTSQNISFPLTIAPGRQQEIKLDVGAYASLPIGAFSETIRIISDDPITPEATVVLNGMVAGAKCRINPEFLSYGNVAAGSTATRTAEFENTGSVDLQINQISWQYGKEFGLAQPVSLPITVAAGGTLTLQVDFSPRVAGFRADRMVVGTAQGLSATLGMQASAI